jgi:parvulin-like peptidyl-prolyl isomerase
MKRSTISLALIVLAVGLALAGCGGAGDVPSDAVAVVDGTEIPRSDLDELMEQAKARYKAQGSDFPKAGTPENQSVQQQYVAFLVQRAEFEHEAEKLGVTVSDKDVEKLRDEVVNDPERFGGDEKKLSEALKEQGLSEEAFLKILRVSVLSDKIFAAVTKDVTVTDADALAQYTQNQDQYGIPESRDVRHILIAEQVDPDCKPSPPTDPAPTQCEVDFAKSKAEADRIYAELKSGADFEALVEEFSADEGSKADGGKYPAVRGASVPEFDKVAFELDTNEISRPVRTQFGYHVIQALADAKPAKVTPFDKVKAAIKAQLLQTKKNEEMRAWLEELQKRYEGKVSYAAGFAPPDLPDATTETE